ncbi:MAG: site-2 protease family protein [Kiritimatiellae bacterium]|nr:site-2 protease family protein [Kiritimatiellia bacterium]MBR1836289.1 site-2 protease family protein [Kiritimatiellia bacterium]
MENLFLMLLRFAALIPAIMIHEIAHGYAALRCGDTTARDEGRLSLNPLRHVDPFMSVILPAILVLTGSSVVFGGAKPVPINLWRCRDPKKAYWITALAGPASNLAQAVLGALLFHVLLHVLPDARFSVYLLYFLISYVVTNVVLMVFNLVPVPPLDGSRVVTVLLPRDLAWRYAQMDRYGMLFVFLLLWIPAFNELIGRATFAVCRFVGLADYLWLLLLGR